MVFAIGWLGVCMGVVVFVICGWYEKGMWGSMMGFCEEGGVGHRVWGYLWRGRDGCDTEVLGRGVEKGTFEVVVGEGGEGGSCGSSCFSKGGSLFI